MSRGGGNGKLIEQLRGKASFTVNIAVWKGSYAVDRKSGSLDSWNWTKFAILLNADKFNKNLLRLSSFYITSKKTVQQVIL